MTRSSVSVDRTSFSRSYPEIFQRRKFPICVFRRKNIADLDIEPVVSPVCDKVNLCHILLSDVDRETSRSSSRNTVFSRTPAISLSR